MRRPDAIERARQGGPRLPLGLLALFLAVALALPGCRGKHELNSTPAVKVAETVRIGIIGDPALAEAIGRLKGEWHAVTGNTVEVVEADTLDALGLVALGATGAEGLRADALVIPATGLGTLVEAGRLVAVPREVRESEQAAWSDLFLLVQQGAVWGDEVWAVPLGTPQLMLLYRRDIFERFGRSPPKTWAEYQELARVAIFFSERHPAGTPGAAKDAPPATVDWHATLEPLGGGWGAKLLLARAAAYAKHRDNFSTLFDIETFKPLVAGPAFVRALEELVAANRGPAPAKPSEAPPTDGDAPNEDEPEQSPPDSGKLDRTQLDAGGVREAFFAGRSAMALTWPTAAGGGREVDVKVGFAELPGGSQMFNFATQRWDERTADESIHVPVIPPEGRLGVVVKGSAHQAAAFDLLAWLAGEKWGTRVVSRSAATTLYRRSQQKEASAWVEPGVDRSAAREYAKVVGEAAGRSVWVDALRIPGWEEYYAALDDAVGQAVRGEATAKAALQTAAERFESISERLGTDVQKAAYRRSLGLEP